MHLVFLSCHVLLNKCYLVAMMIRQTSVTQTPVHFSFSITGKHPWSRGSEQASGSDSSVNLHSAGPSGLCFWEKKIFSHGRNILGHLKIYVLGTITHISKKAFTSLKKSVHLSFNECLRKTFLNIFMWSKHVSSHYTCPFI